MNKNTQTRQWSEEDRKKALENRKQTILEGHTLYKQDWLDDNHWLELAKKYKVKLPTGWLAPKTARIRNVAKQLQLPEDWHTLLFGVTAPKGLKNAIEAENARQPEGSKYGCRCYIGHLLEMKESRNVTSVGT